MKTLMSTAIVLLFVVSAADADARRHRDGNNYPRIHRHSGGCGHEDPRPQNPIPEPSAALAFGAGMLILGRSVRGRRS